jgi:hypothetical protein
VSASFSATVAILAIPVAMAHLAAVEDHVQTFDLESLFANSTRCKPTAEAFVLHRLRRTTRFLLSVFRGALCADFGDLV